MFEITELQLQKMAPFVLKAFIRREAAFIQNTYPNFAAQLANEALETFTAGLISKAKSWGFEAEISVHRFIVVNFEYGWYGDIKDSEILRILNRKDYSSKEKLTYIGLVMDSREAANTN